MQIEKQLKSHGAWIGKWTFILAATGSAVGLGNIWGFPYKAGTNGGGAFVLIYLACILAIGLPIMISEVVIGRRAGNSPVNAMRRIAIDSNTTPLWRFVGWSGIFAGVLILSYCFSWYKRLYWQNGKNTNAHAWVINDFYGYLCSN